MKKKWKELWLKRKQLIFGTWAGLIFVCICIWSIIIYGIVKLFTM